MSASSTVKDLSNRLRTLTGALSECRHVGYLTSDAVVLLADLDRNQPIENFTTFAGQRMLVLMAAAEMPRGRVILQNVLEAVFSGNHLLNRVDAKEAKRLFQSHLSLERRFFEDSAQALPEAGYRAFFIDHNTLYPLHREATDTCYVYRVGRLLTFQLSPHQCVGLEPEDFLMISHPQDMAMLLKSNTLRHIHRAFLATPFIDPTAKKGFQRIRPLLHGPLIGIHGVPSEKRPGKPFPDTRITWALAAILLVWAIVSYLLPALH